MVTVMSLTELLLLAPAAFSFGWLMEPLFQRWLG
jgi:hypothetical protein